MRLSTLEECFQDAVVTRERLSSNIDELITSNKESPSSTDRLDQVKDDLASIVRNVTHERRQTKSLRLRLQRMRSTLKERRDAITAEHAEHQEISEDLEVGVPQVENRKEAHTNVTDEISAQKRRICSDLASIYPIDPLPNRALAFTIRGLPLPNSSFADVQEDAISAALGHVAHVVHILSFYLSTPLPYPILPSSSTTSIHDPISIMSGSRIFPLYLPRAIFYRFEYGVFLLNKNIELLASRMGLKLMDIRQTLPNLKYVLYVATAGKGDLPARNAGGIRGLLLSRKGQDTPDSSRRSSFDNHKPIQANLRAQLAERGKHENGFLKSGGAWAGKQAV